jgi:hypothetical protein
MQLDLTDEETLALLNLLTEAIEGDRYPYSPRGPDLARHPRKVRADGAGAATAGPAADTRRARPVASAAPGKAKVEVRAP